MSIGLQNLEHIVVLMLENRSFDHMLGSLKTVDSRIDGITDQMRNPDSDNRRLKSVKLPSINEILTSITVKNVR
jgi:phospholipase C